MAAFTIRLSDEDHASIQAAAQAAGKATEAWAREFLIERAKGPVVRERYAYRALGNGSAVIKRTSNHPNGTVVTGSGWTQEIADVMQRVNLLVSRNEVGDREAAVALLQQHFELVAEIGI